ncbi:MAG: MarR family winged helix-turn-helix transcriptional regulator [Clostridium sp.]|uniref:MarR family winged helix-turn-helix transcriptional regulator n=1 Tax=Clostridium sp. TaxID=1506 RepID=UPI003EE729E6
MNSLPLDLLRNAALFRKQYYIYISKTIKDFDLNISSAEFGFLKELIYNDGVIQEVLVHNTCIDKAATSRLIKSLESKNLIKRIRNEHDKRSFNVFLTDEGKKLVPSIEKILTDWFSLVQNSVGSDNLKTFMTLFESINQNSFK